MLTDEEFQNLKPGDTVYYRIYRWSCLLVSERENELVVCGAAVVLETNSQYLRRVRIQMTRVDDGSLSNGYSYSEIAFDRGGWVGIEDLTLET